MSDLPSILPSNATDLERRLEQFSGRTVGFSDPIVRLWNPDTCPSSVLPWLAWSLSVDSWDPTWTVAVKRRAVKEAVTLHQKKGTVGAVRRAIEVFGFGVAVILEGVRAQLHDGSFNADGSEIHSLNYTFGGMRTSDGEVIRTADGEELQARVFSADALSHWAEYRVVLKRPITIAQSQELRAILERVAPARSHLAELVFTQVANVHDGAIFFDGTISHGAS